MNRYAMFCLVALGLGGPVALPAGAQVAASPGAPATATAPADATDCPPAAGTAEPATAQTATTDGTAPSNAGSSGWSGGLGGSQIGTNPQGATAETKTWHAPTARGLDLNGAPEPAPRC